MIKTKNVKLGKFTIGENYPVRIIAEIADNHNGSVKTAKKMILAAKKAGADIVKFQLHLPDVEMVPNSVKMWAGNLSKLLKKNLLTIKQHKEIKNFCHKNNIMYLCTPFCSKAADLLDSIAVSAFKIGSGEMTNLPMIEHIAKKGKPMIVSTGMSTWSEIVKTVNIIKKQKTPLILMNCISEYPPDYRHINLNLIKKMKRAFHVPVGQSDHTPDIYTALASVACGAKIIEKHFTLNKKQRGADHFFSLEPPELQMLVDGVRKIEKSLGDKKKIWPQEKTVREWATHSIVAAENLAKDAIITETNIIIKRPGTGIPAANLKDIIGKRVKRPIPKNSLIKWEDIYEK